MNLNERFPVSPAKLEDLKNRIRRLGIRLDQVEETFTRGSGHGGQKINKTSSCVVLRYPPLEMVVKMQKLVCNGPVDDACFSKPKEEEEQGGEEKPEPEPKPAP